MSFPANELCVLCKFWYLIADRIILCLYRLLLTNDFPVALCWSDKRFLLSKMAVYIKPASCFLLYGVPLICGWLILALTWLVQGFIWESRIASNLQQEKKTCLWQWLNWQDHFKCTHISIHTKYTVLIQETYFVVLNLIIHMYVVTSGMYCRLETNGHDCNNMKYESLLGH